jgi:hypothetical protein
MYLWRRTPGTLAAVGYGARCIFLENFDLIIYFWKIMTAMPSSPSHNRAPRKQNLRREECLRLIRSFATVPHTLLGAFRADTYWGRYWTVVVPLPVNAVVSSRELIKNSNP